MKSQYKFFTLFWRYLNATDRRSVVENGFVEVRNKFGVFHLYAAYVPYNIMFYPSGTSPVCYRLCAGLLYAGLGRQVRCFEQILHQLLMLRFDPKAVLDNANNVVMIFETEKNSLQFAAQLDCKTFDSTGLMLR
jgi:hypothetical protein